MKADIKIRPLIKLIPRIRFTAKRKGVYWIKYSLYFDWLMFTLDIDNF